MLSMKFSLLINLKMPTQLAFSYLLAENCSCPVMSSKTEYAVVSNLRFLAEQISCSAELNMKKVLYTWDRFSGPLGSLCP